MAIRKDEGIVLRSFDFRETSKIASIYTENSGKILGIFKGFKNKPPHFSTTLDIFSLNEFIFYESKSEIWLVSYADMIESFSFIKTDSERNIIACSLLELVDKTISLHLPSQDIFNLLKEALYSFKDFPPERIVYIFQIKFLSLAGFRPTLENCLRCLKPIGVGFSFSIKLGGLLCKDCSIQENSSHSISPEVIASLRYIQHSDFRKGLRLKPSLKAEKEILNILERFLGYHLETKLKSLIFLGRRND